MSNIHSPKAIEDLAVVVNVRSKWIGHCRAEDYQSANKVLQSYTGCSASYTHNTHAAIHLFMEYAPAWRIGKLEQRGPYWVFGAARKIPIRGLENGRWEKFACRRPEGSIVAAALFWRIRFFQRIIDPDTEY